jgi:hypothetical protein
MDVVQSSSSSASARAGLITSESITAFIWVIMRTAWGKSASSTGVCL